MPKFDRKLLRVPLFVATLMTGLVMIAMILTVMFSWSKVKNFSLYEKVVAGGLFGLVVGVHGLLHLGLEVAYDFDPKSENKLKKSLE